jgi:hypothetical protein
MGGNGVDVRKGEDEATLFPLREYAMYSTYMQHFHVKPVMGVLTSHPEYVCYHPTLDSHSDL